MSKIARIYQGLEEIQKYYQGGVLQKLFFDWKHYIGTELNIEYAKECAGRNIVISGKTYQNLFKAELSQGHADSALISKKTLRVNSEGFNLPVKNFTILVPKEFEVLIYPNYVNNASGFSPWKSKIVWSNSSETNNIRIMIRKPDESNITVDEVKGKIVLLEGDYTDIDIPTRIDGIESVAEREENLVNTATIYESMLESGVVDSLFNPKSSSTYDVYKMEIQPNTEYLFNLVGYGQAPWVRILDKNNIIVKSQNLSSSGLSYIWSLKTEGNFYYLVFNKPKTSTGTFQVYKKENPYPLKLAINEEINLINLPIPLRSLPNGVCDIIEENRLVQRVGKVVLDGSNASNFKQVNSLQVFRWEYFFDTREFVSGICDTFPIKNVQTLSDENKGIRLSGISFKSIDIKLPDDTGFDIDTFKNWLSENPITVHYELVTPVETELNLPTISVKEGTNFITTTNNIKPNIQADCLVKDDFQNMCDNEWERGDINSDNGTNGTTSGDAIRIRLVNYIQTKPNTKYRMDIVNSVETLSKGYIGARYYDNEKSYLDMGGAIGTISKSSIVFTTPENCYYIRLIAETKDVNFKIYLKEVIN